MLGKGNDVAYMYSDEVHTSCINDGAAVLCDFKCSTTINVLQVSTTVRQCYVTVRVV